MNQLNCDPIIKGIPLDSEGIEDEIDLDDYGKLDFVI